ncbi:hypothetical protein PZ938_01290 [Luteipulveratus sp. YIM 133132]|uniref:hypothetical protein n=1 Tax=Luteipulveratus flavus TaxID=3031728 RepID=UPI0023AE8657|nr:hypothetical protein [Luteipulveratus sp. YIM 133132]MDE9364229.1 hypothetical protein [Luteipulveratus sp. YIM 133132]
MSEGPDSALSSQDTALTGRQRAVVEAFGDRHNLVAWYLGARSVLGQDGNPDRLAQSAHSIRELLEKLPHHFDVPVEKRAFILSERARVLGQSFDKAVAKSKTYEDGKWSGEIDAPLRQFLQRAEDFFGKLAVKRPPRSQEAKGFIRATDPSPLPLPDTIEELRIKEWNAYRDYFISVAHHRSAEPDEFERWLELFEDFILKQLVPRTFEDRAEIRELIEEAEGRAHE